MAKKALPQKKKGPKGKKARASAKLDRQWGEEDVNENKKSGKRQGKSRLITKKKKISSGEQSGENQFQENELPTTNFSEYDENDSPSSDDDDEEESTTGTAPLANLLQSIRKKTNRSTHKIKADDDYMLEDDETYDLEEEDIMEEKEDVGSTEESDSDEEEDVPVQDDKEDDNDSVQATHNNLDLFRERFGCGPLKDKELKAPPIASKIPIDASLELQVSCAGTGLDAILPTKTNTAAKPISEEEWQKLSNEAFEGNRELLQRQWKRKQKRGMTQSQSQLYPFLTRYADMLVTTESQKVRGYVGGIIGPCRSFFSLLV
jgi:hypothetical protein